MAVMISSLEILLLASDYFTLLLDPIIRRILQAFSFRKKLVYSLECPWLVKDQSVEFSLSGLSSEIERFEEMYIRMLNDTHKLRLSLLDSLKQTINTFWPWLKGFHLTQVNAIDRQLNWTNSYDLYLIDDWDFPRFAPTFSFDMSSNSELIAVSPSKMDLQDATCFPSLQHHYQPNEGTLFMYMRPKRHNTTQQTENEPRETSGTFPPFICAKLMKSSEFELHSSRANLIFYYMQIHPELNALYLVVGRSLELANLLEPSVCHLAAAAAAATPTQSSKTPDKPDERENGSRHLSRYTLVLMLVAYLNSSQFKTIRKNFQNTTTYLSQILLNFLQVYAEFESNINGHYIYIRPSLKVTSELEMSLDERQNDEVNEQRVSCQLVVLDPLSSLKGSSDKIIQTQTKSELEQIVLEAVGKPTTRTEASKLIALNNINKESDLGCLTNLTKDFLSLGEVLRLFRCLNEQLLEYIGDSKKRQECREDGMKSLLDSLFTLSSSSSCKTVPAAAMDGSRMNFNAYSSGLMISDSFRYSAFLKASQHEFREVNKEGKLGEHESVVDSGWFQWPTIISSKRHPTARIRNESSVNADRKRQTGRKKLSTFGLNGKFSLSWRKILTNLLYLSIFLLVRDELLSHLNGFLSSVHEQTRHDLIQLKHFVLTSNHGSGLFAEASELEEGREQSAEPKIEPVLASSPTFEEATNVTERVNDEIWTSEKEESSTLAPTMDSQELIGELMRSMMMEAFQGGDFDLSSLFGDDLEDSSSKAKDADDDDDDDEEDAAAADSKVDDEMKEVKQDEATEQVTENNLTESDKEYENEDKLDLSEMRELFKSLKVAIKGAAFVSKLLQSEQGKKVFTTTTTTTTPTPEVAESLEPQSVNIDVNQTETPSLEAVASRVEL